MSSKEYQIRIAKPRVREIVSTLDQILAKRIPLREEVTCWARVASRFADNELWQAVRSLVDLDIVDKKIGGLETLYFENYALCGTEILDCVVVEYLSGKIRR